MILSNIDFWSALCGLIGTSIIFFCGFPPQINPSGRRYLALEQEDSKMKNKAKILKVFSYLGLFLIFISYLLLMIKMVFS